MKNLLIVVDYQNDFVDGALGFPGAENLENYIVDKIIEFKESGQDIVFTKDMHEFDYLETEEGKNLPVEHCMRFTKGADLYGRVKELAKGYTIIEKETFGARGLFPYLSRHRYDNIYLVGLVSYICVVSNAIVAKAGNPLAHIVILKDGTSGPDKEAEKIAFEAMKALQIEVR